MANPLIFNKLFSAITKSHILIFPFDLKSAI